MSSPEKVKINLYQPHQNQLTVINHPARFKVLTCGRRFGKTTLAINELVYHALLKPNSDYWYVAPTYRQAKEIAWRMLKKLYYTLPEELQQGTNESELWVEVGNKSRISLKGADNEDSLRGSALDAIIIDEVDSVVSWSALWNEVLSPSLVDRKGWAWFIGTPKGYSNLYHLSSKQDPDYQAFHFTSYDNPHIDPEELDKERQRLTDDEFAQEYLADFRKHSGLIYREFDRKTHVVDEIELPGNDMYYRTMDFGAGNPTACLWIRTNGNQFWVYDEYYQTEKTTDYHAGQILARHPQTFFTANFADPSGKQSMLDYAHFGLHLTPANKQILDTLTGTMKSPNDQDWVAYGISQVRQWLKVQSSTREPRLLISSKCVNLIKEIETYHWEEGREQLKDVPHKTNDHALDALRYFAVSYQRFRKKQYRQPPRYIGSSLTAY